MTDRKRILLVEDHYRLAYEWKQALEETGLYQVDIALTSVEASPYFEKYDHDAYLLDMYHEESGVFYKDGGLHLLHKIYRKYGPLAKDKLIIMVTGFHRAPMSMDIQSVVESMGVKHFLRKPIDIDTIIQLLRKES